MEQKFSAIRCRSCGRVMYPRHDRCISCRGKDFDEFEPEKVGKLITYTKLYAVPEGIDMPPLALGIVEFPGGLRVLGQLTTDEPKMGMKFQPVWGLLRKIGAKEVFGFKFEPVG